VTPALTFAPLATAILALVENPMFAMLIAFVAWGIAGLAASFSLPGTGADDPLVPVTGRTASP
jgi:hypothetical protein